MSQGQEHVEAALSGIARAGDAIALLSEIDEAWRGQAATRLAANTTLLREAADRFFLKTRVCLPFAGRCEDEAGKLEALATELSTQPVPDGQARLQAALEALEKAVRALDERSQMKGMAIT